MTQSKYVREILSRFDMENCKAVTTPLNPSEKLSKDMCPETEDEKREVEKLRYQNLIGSLMYLIMILKRHGRARPCIQENWRRTRGLC